MHAEEFVTISVMKKITVDELRNYLNCLSQIKKFSKSGIYFIEDGDEVLIQKAHQILMKMRLKNTVEIFMKEQTFSTN